MTNKMLKFDFTSYYVFKHENITHCMVCFVPAINIGCSPPFIKGKKTSRWIKYRKRPMTKEALEGRIGMSIESWD